jgi:cell division protease FtsH
MSLVARPEELPEQIPAAELAALAYPTTVADICAALLRRLSSLVDCPKEVAPYLAHALRSRLKSHNLKCITLDGRGPAPDRVPLVSSGLLANMRQALLDSVRGPAADTVLVLPHLDLMAGGTAGEAREVAALLVENPEILWVGFRDPAVPLLRLVEQLPLYRARVGGVPRDRLRFLVTRAEGRKFGGAVDLARLYRRVSGLNVVQLRKYLGALDREDLPADPGGALAELRRLTLPPGCTVPDERLAEVGGYPMAKAKLDADLLGILARIDAAGSDEERGRLERLLPRGVLLTGPPGVGKRLLARGLASAVGAAFLETTGAELKSRYVGGSEENLRLLFAKARQAAPAVVLFKELDAFAARPGRGVTEPSLFLQLLQELDELPRGELVFAVGTAPAASDLDSAVVQPGRFELVIELGPPTAEYRAAILSSSAAGQGLELSREAAERAVELSASPPPAPPHHGARLAALCRGLARLRALEGGNGPVKPAEVERVWASL